MILITYFIQAERRERDMMKQEQDAAYNESLAADRAKKEAEKERQNQELEKMQQAQMEEDLKEVSIYY